MSIRIEVDLSGADEAARAMQDFRNALADRRGLHARMSVGVKQFTQDYLRKLKRHRTAERLGARPTGHHARSANVLEAEHDNEEARLVIPRNTGLGRAFGFVVLRPTGGRKWLTIPAHARTYGRGVRDFPEGTFQFTTLFANRPFAVMRFTKSGPGYQKGDVAYYLRKMVYQKQDPTLLPSDAAFREVGRRAALSYLSREVFGEPRGGISTGMPSA
jgi:hypothetical protein